MPRLTPLTCLLLSVCFTAGNLFAAEPVGVTVESVDAGTVRAKDAQGKIVTVIVDETFASRLRPGQVISIDQASGTIVAQVAMPYRSATADDELQATANAASKAKDKKKTGSGTVVVPDTKITASEGSTAMAIRGRPNTSARELPGLKGEFSPAEENEDEEEDPIFPMERFVLPGEARQASASSEMRIASYSRGGGAQNLADRLASGLKNKEINVALLGGQKYMVADCLGIKASAGEFTLKLANPSARLEGSGAMLQFEIEKIEMSALKVRFKPNSNLLKPCKWSKRKGIGGKASNVRLEISIDPLLDLERCRVADPGRINVKVRIGGLNLDNVNNEIDKVAKNMIEDSVTFALQMVSDAQNPGNQILQTLDDILEIDCPGNPGGTADGAEELASKVGNAATVAQSKGPAGGRNMKLPGGGITAARAGGEKATAFTMVANPALKGRLGRLVIAFPADAKTNDTRYDVFKAGEDKSVQGGYGKAEIDLMPGKYTVEVAKKRVANVEVGSRQDTVLTVGCLRVNAGKDTRVDILDADKKTKLVGGYGTIEYGLPVGTYHVQIAGSTEEVTVEAGKVTEF